MTWEEHVRTGFLPTIIDELVIMTSHEEALREYLQEQTRRGDHDHQNQYYYNRMLSIIEVYRQFLSRAQ